MSESFQGSSWQNEPDQQETPDRVFRETGRKNRHHRDASISSSESHSSNDGIEWETPGDDLEQNNSDYDQPYSDYDSDEGNDDDYDDSYEEQDTQRLLATSSNTRMGGMGMGMRVGETGTGTTIGLDFAQAHRQDDPDYDALPMTTVDSARTDRGRSIMHSGMMEDDPRNQRGVVRSKRRERRGRRHASSTPGHDPGEPLTEQEKMIAKRQLRVNMCWNIFYVCAWYGCSTSLSFYNKWLFSPNHYNFRFPLFTTCLHMVAQFALSSLTLALLPSLRPKAAPSAKDFGTKIMPCAVASGLDVGLSNSSLKTITLAFYTMCKSSSLAFVLMFAFIFKLERPTWTLAGVIGVICVGLFMMVMSEVDFVLIGFIQVMLASVLGGLRWSLTQLLLERTDTKAGSLANPISTIFFLSPIMGICLCVVAGIFEGYRTIFSSDFFSSFGTAIGTLGLLFFGGIIAFAMVLAEFNLIARTSVVSLSVLGIIKEVITIVVSSLVFHDHLTVVNILGLFVTLTGIGFYHFMKLREMKKSARLAAKEIADMALATASNHRRDGADRMSLHEYRRKKTGRSAMKTERPPTELRVEQAEARGAGINDSSKGDERNAAAPSSLEGSPLIFGLGEEEEEEEHEEQEEQELAFTQQS
ncbi:solute carrier family 35, member C2 [Entomortierella parvispora]|uniref:Solute carrier family 35, member C2 n=1 Tax=Entomortierella parvispora TaxID=205924 RepID=A0A9P3HJT2_9FUNG|nr:solute carrier family 35, member C2 [Entomortierella parvispora]